MFSKIQKTAYPPKTRPILIWDGECGFCKNWVIRLQKRTVNRIDFETYQEKAVEIPDIPLNEFKKASRLIEVDGRVYSGPDSLYRSLDHATRRSWPWHRWYVENTWFARLSDEGYNYIAKNRPLMFKLTKALFGDRPRKPRPYWVLYFIVVFLLLVLILG